MKKLLLICILIVGCGEQADNSKVNDVTIFKAEPFTGEELRLSEPESVGRAIHRATIDGHLWLIVNGWRQFGIAHHPDCLLCKEVNNGT